MTSEASTTANGAASDGSKEAEQADRAERIPPGAASPAQDSKRTAPGRVRAVMVAVAIVSLLVTGLGWALSSPTGGSPDDDYHLGSIWCPRPLESSGCQTSVINGEIQVLVPEKVSDESVCYAFHSDRPAACRLSMSDSDMDFSRRYDAGNYPYGYYQFHHLFVADNVDRAVLVMRSVNLLIAVVVLAATGAALPGRMRQGFALAVIVSWVPMGLYFVASNNPSTWALTGVLAYGAALHGALHSEGRRRRVLLPLAMIGALLCFTSRGDAAFFVFVVSLAVLVAAPWGRRQVVPALLAAGASALGVWIMLSTGQAGATSTFAPAESDYSGRRRVVMNLLSLPDYLAGFYGRRWGAGWFDVPFDGPIAVLALGLAGAALVMGARAMSWRKAAGATVILGAMTGIPLVVALQNQWHYVFQYQPRYQLPLLAVFFLLWLTLTRRGPIVSIPQAVLIVATSSIIHALALRTLIYRYTHGLWDPALDLTADLNADVAWWRNIPLSPTALWILTSLAFTLALSAAVVLTAPTCDGPAAPGRPGDDQAADAGTGNSTDAGTGDGTDDAAGKGPAPSAESVSAPAGT